MFKKRCSLCGGNLIGGKCQECGLDNTKKRMYQENEWERGSKRFAEHEKPTPHGGVSNEEFFSQIREDQEALEKQSTYTKTDRNNRAPEGMPPFGRPPRGNRTTASSEQQERPKKRLSPISVVVILFIGIQIFSVIISVVFAIIQSLFANF